MWRGDAEQVAEAPSSHTGRYLKRCLAQHPAVLGRRSETGVSAALNGERIAESRALGCAGRPP